MTFKLSYSDNKWAEEDLSIFTNEFIENYDINGDDCYIMDLDIECPPKIHDKLFDYPVLCEKKIPSGSNSKTEKLINTFDKKEGCVTHICMLQHAINPF